MKADVLYFVTFFNDNDNVLDRCLGKSIFKYVNDLTAVFKLHTLRFSGIVRKS